MHKAPEGAAVIRGSGTVVNVATVLVGSGLGVALGARLRERTRTVVTDGLGLVTLLVAALDAVAVRDSDLRQAVGGSAPVLIVLGAVLVGGVVGSLVGIEAGLDRAGTWLQARARAQRAPEHSPHPDGEQRPGQSRFVEGFVLASLVYCVGPLTVVGSLSDGLGHGATDLYLKSTLDGFASVAFAASLGWGVAASALTVAVVQGTLTAAAYAAGSLLSAAEVAALTATGGVLLVGVGLRLLAIKPVAVADLLPALVVAPAATAVVAALR
jgi:uncharacterized membrane protein YqgA involved in biofilm formation